MGARSEFAWGVAIALGDAGASGLGSGRAPIACADPRHGRRLVARRPKRRGRLTAPRLVVWARPRPTEGWPWVRRGDERPKAAHGLNRKFHRFA